MAETVVLGPLLAVEQDLIGFRRLAESFFGLFIPRVATREILHRQLAVGLLGRVLAGGAVDAEHFVVITLLRHRVLLGRTIQKPSHAVEGGLLSSAYVSVSGLALHFFEVGVDGVVLAACRSPAGLAAAFRSATAIL